MYAVLISMLPLFLFVNGAAVSYPQLMPREVRDPRPFVTTTRNQTTSTRPNAYGHDFVPTRNVATAQPRLATRSKRAYDPADTPAPTGESSPDTTVHISDTDDFALLLPSRDGGASGTASSSSSRVLLRGY